MLIILNNKSNLEKQEFDNYIKKLNNINTENELVLCPSDIYLNNLKLNNISIGSQDVSSYDDGAHTGEVSARQLKDLGVKYSIVGHSERRLQNHETNSDINKKIKLLNEEGIIPILCVGEKEEEKNIKKEVIGNQIREALNGNDIKSVIIAYEPVWSIGTGKTPSIEEINEIISFIKTIVPNNKIVYGGSVNCSNIDLINNSTELDGYLLGKLSLDIISINKFIKKI